MSRVQYILSQQGIEVLEETEQLDDKELIMEVMEAREELEEADSEEVVAEIRSRNDGMYFFSLCASSVQPLLYRVCLWARHGQTK